MALLLARSFISFSACSRRLSLETQRFFLSNLGVTVWEASPVESSGCCSCVRGEEGGREGERRGGKKLTKKREV